MRDLFKAEWLRYRLWTPIYAVAHLLALAFFMRLVDMGQQPLNVFRIIGACYVLSGILLGLHQYGTWRRPNQWLNLLHRPLAPRRIAAALLGAGVVAIVSGVVLPIAIALAWQAWGTAHVVDLRHLLMPIAAGLLACAGYLAGAYGVLADRRYASCALVFLFWLFAAQASGPQLLVVQGIACAWLLALVLVAFRPDLGTAPRSPAAVALTAVPVQMTAYLLLLLVGFVGELAWIMQGTHPVNMTTPPHGGFVETERMSGRDRMLAGLDGATIEQAPVWREQVALSDVHEIDRELPGVAARQEMSNTAPTAFDDAEARLRWTFSHDRMRFEGARLTDGRHAGERGIGAEDAAFSAIATPAGALPGMGKGDVALLAGPTLYQYVASVGRIIPRLTVDDGERLLGTQALGGSLVAVSDRALYVFDGRHLLDAPAPVRPRQRVAIPGSPGDQTRTDMVELVDGYLISFTFSRRAFDMLGAPPYQTLLWVDDTGKVVPIATRALNADFPVFYRYRSWWASPLLYTLRERATAWFATPTPYREYATPAVPSSMRWLAAALSLVSAVSGAWLAWRRALSLRARLTWTIACAVVGLPALASLVLIVPRAEPSFRPVNHPAIA
ncbi:MAG: hypothetical protein ABW193_11855 [Luteibacter sp.]